MVKPRIVDEKPKPHIAKCYSLSDAILIAMTHNFERQTVEIVEYHGKFYVLPLDKPAKTG